MDRLGGGSIINMGSTSYLSSADSFVAYKSAKSAVTGLTRSTGPPTLKRGDATVVNLSVHGQSSIFVNRECLLATR
jgi:NAD(P)-dependent dehydrogenase (short-subunit alcohol dehydrogenase family)